MINENLKKFMDQPEVFKMMSHAQEFQQLKVLFSLFELHKMTFYILEVLTKCLSALSDDVTCCYYLFKTHRQLLHALELP